MIFGLAMGFASSDQLSDFAVIEQIRLRLHPLGGGAIVAVSMSLATSHKCCLA